jgi:hypothetical protein
VIEALEKGGLSGAHPDPTCPTLQPFMQWRGAQQLVAQSTQKGECDRWSTMMHDLGSGPHPNPEACS